MFLSNTHILSFKEVPKIQKLECSLNGSYVLLVNKNNISGLQHVNSKGKIIKEYSFPCEVKLFVMSSDSEVIVPLPDLGKISVIDLRM